ncbi:MAG: sugar ABC transporter substrate-binding protein [Clostridiales bacterium]|nr:sugar ABC transporter substrate-binding protein [Clostridiales bacterium]
MALMVLALVPATSMAEADKPKLTVWVYGWETDYLEFHQEMAAKYDKAEIELVPVTYDVYNQKIQATLAGGDTPDIAMIDAGVLTTQLADKGALLALDEYLDVPALKDKFVQGAWDSLVWQDKLYGLRITSNNLALFYNKAMFDAKGVAYPTNEWTWDDLKTAAAELTDKDNGVYGIGLPVFENGESKVWNWMTFLWQAGGQYLTEDRTKAAFNTEQGVKALSFWKELVTSGVCPLEAAGAGVNRFTGEQVAMTVDGTWSLRGFMEDPDFAAKVGVAYLPKDVEHATNIGGEGFVAFAGTEYPQAAAEYLQYLTTDKEFVEGFYKAWITVPCLIEYGNFYTDAEVPYLEQLNVFINQAADAGHSRQFTPVWTAMSDAVSLEIEECLFNDKAPEDAMADAAAAVDKLLAGE